ncbi:MAG TPA: hypothetical protein VI756_04760 [Blastocatellia bacterium]
MSVATDKEMEILEAAAEAGDEWRFARTAKAMNWPDRRPDEVIRAIRLAIQAGAYLTFRELSELGARLFPDNRELQKAANILAPPKVTASRPVHDPAIRANRDWLKEHWDEYKGKWIGLRNGTLVGVADSFEEVRDRGFLGRDTLITRVC